jgi:hypothetical protein
LKFSETGYLEAELRKVLESLNSMHVSFISIHAESSFGQTADDVVMEEKATEQATDFICCQVFRRAKESKLGSELWQSVLHALQVKIQYEYCSYR